MATDVVTLLQVPPIAASVKVVIVPEHINVNPDMAEGAAYTVTVVATPAPQPVV